MWSSGWPTDSPLPFALAAGLTGTAMATSKLVVIAGLAEIAAGSIAMGSGGYLAARTDRDHYESERAREVRETVELPHKEREEVADVFREFGMSEEHIKPVVDAISADQKRWVDFMMRFELGFEEPDPLRARNSAVDHRRFIYSGRSGAALVVHAGGRFANGAALVRAGHADGAVYLRVRER